MNKLTWTNEQEDVLGSTSRVTLVRAGPGSGKTKTFVELLSRQLASWQDRHRGIAALSFTNVAKEEIARRLGGDLPSPHFVGTIDAFLLRFVIGPFGHLGGIKPSGARLIPSPLDDEIHKPTIGFTSKQGKPNPVPLFRIAPIAGVEASPRFSVRPEGHAKSWHVPPERVAEILESKRREWASRGRITHADSHYLAAAIICGSNAAGARQLVARRFPLILVDEFQDTGHFLGRALLPILAEIGITAVLVGDEDQRIFGFSGVDSALFSRVEGIEGCKTYPLRISQRCASRVAAVATLLSRSGSPVVPKDDAPDGAAILLVHDDPKGACSSLLRAEAVNLCRQHHCKRLAVLVRRREEKRLLLTSDVQKSCPLKAAGSQAVHRAVTRLLDGRGDQASRIIEGRLGHLLLDNESPHREDFEQAGVDPTEFRRRARRLTLEAAEFRAQETWGQWRERMKEALRKATEALGGNDFGGRLGGMFKQMKGDKPELPRIKPSMSVTPSPADDPTTEVLTIHEAKGREFDAVLVYCPKPSKHEGGSTCPSEAWWSSATDSEEREVAFVAVTRAKLLLILAVHSATFASFQEQRSEFLAHFDPVKACLDDAK